MTAAEGGDVLVTFKTTAAARCSLSAAGNEFIMADIDGTVQLHLAATKDALDGIIAPLKCGKDGASAPVPRIVLHHGVRQPAQPAAKGTVLPLPDTDVTWVSAALGFDVLTASDEQLLAHDLPRRPDPAHRESWLRAVASPVKRIVHKGLVANGRHASGPISTVAVGSNTAQSVNWAGTSVAVGTYNARLASAEWRVPNAYVGAVNRGEMSEWVGIDGGYSPQQPGGIGDVVQNGIAISSYNSGGYIYNVYTIWHEYFPDYVRYDGYVNPGDDIYCQSSVSGFGISPTGQFWCKDITAGAVVSTTESAPSGVDFVGGTAEFILERPDFPEGPYDRSNVPNGGLFPLAWLGSSIRYGDPILMTGTYWMDAGYNWHTPVDQGSLYQISCYEISTNDVLMNSFQSGFTTTQFVQTNVQI